MPGGVYERSRPVEGCPLTASELDAVRLTSEGLTMQQSALALGKTVSTIRCQLATARRRLGAVNTSQVILRCEREGWIGSQPGSRSRAEALLEEIRPILEACLHQLEQGGRHRVTRSQYAYLKAYDAFLRRPAHDTDGSLGRALTAVLEDAEVTPSARPRRNRGRTRRLGLREAA